MSTTSSPRPAAGMDTSATDALLRMGRRFHGKADVAQDLRTITREGGRDADTFYRDRWSHDKVVRSTHGVNCTGSCSWKVYVKDGIITWEAQQTDYPSVGPDSPEYEPRGCPRGAAFSWYTYSPTRVRYPYARGVLLEMYREAKAAHGGDPVEAWRSIVEDPEKARRYKQARGKGGLVRVTWEEAVEIAAIDPSPHGPERSDPGGALCQWLTRHGARAEIAVLARTLPRISEILNRRATETGASLIVMGAYGHSRFREAILGGATRGMLEQAAVPVLMAR